MECRAYELFIFAVLNLASTYGAGVPSRKISAPGRRQTDQGGTRTDNFILHLAPGFSDQMRYQVLFDEVEMTIAR